jgi:hypothetical protein
MYTARSKTDPRRLTLLIAAAAPLVAAGLTSDLASAAEHVIQISVDGLRPSYLQDLITAGNAPNFKRFQTEGAWTNNSRTDYAYTITLPNHTSMLTGRPVTQPAGQPNTLHHGWITNVDPLPSATLHNSGNLNVPYKASTFDVVHDAGLSTAHFASKSKFKIYDQSYNATTGADHPNGRDKIDVFFAQENASATMQTQLLAGLSANHFNYTFVHYADPDIAGHSSGWGNTAWRNAVVTVDGYLGQLFNLVTTDPTFAGHTAIVLTADHGGEGNGHDNAASANNYTIPFYAWGAGVAAGDIYDFNNGVKANPGTTRPDYNAPAQPIRNGDSGNLAVFLLGLDSIPGSLMNSNHNMRVALPGDYNIDNSVDVDDLLVWSANFGQPHHAHRELGDDNGDHDVDGADFLSWQRQLGTAPATAPVPEPATFGSLALLLTFGLLKSSRERRGRLGAKARGVPAGR